MHNTENSLMDDEQALALQDCNGFPEMDDDQAENPSEPAFPTVAVVGMACRFPGASSLNQFWSNLCQGVCSITFHKPEALRAAGVAEDLIKAPNFVPAIGAVADIDMFDAAFFGISPKEADVLDPQQRILLELAHETIEDAGYQSVAAPNIAGIFVGVSRGTYLSGEMDPNRPDPAGYFQEMVGNNRDFLATKLAYKLNLTGPAVNVLTACSTSLVAIHMAVQAILAGECDVALAGGACIRLPQTTGYLYHPDLIFSPDGFCRAFDASANGVVSGNGAGLVMLKAKSLADQDRDRIYALVVGSAVNNDGSDKIGYTAPSLNGQEQVIRQAMGVAGVGPGDIDYVETHGTGTPLGDPIEISALSAAMGDPTHTVAIGSVKPNIGHLDAAAGIAGFIKATLALTNRFIPPSLFYTKPNPRIDFSAGFKVQTALAPWPKRDRVRRAAVSSFGIGGTNAHVILEEPIAPISEETCGSSRKYELLVLSAKTQPAFTEYVNNMVTFLENQTPERLDDSKFLADLCFSATTGRAHYLLAGAWVANSGTQLLSVLKQAQPKRPQLIDSPRIAFLCTGQGSAWSGMGFELFQSDPVFQNVLAEGERIYQALQGQSLLEMMFHGDDRIHQTQFTQPCLYVLEVALAEMWRSWGIEPAAIMGHSVGEYAAAHIAGVFSFEDGLALITARAELMQALPSGGGMVAVFKDAATVKDLLAEWGLDLSLAALNGPANTVVSGLDTDLATMVEGLKQRGIKAKELEVSHAFHSSLIKPIIAAFARKAEGVQLHPPKLPLVSNLTGQLIGPEIATPAYWVRHTWDTVLFEQGIQQLAEFGCNVWVEIGPAPVLVGMGRRCLSDDRHHVFLPSLRPNRSEWNQLFESLGDIYLAGVAVDWKGVHSSGTGKRISIPSYPFQRKSHWIHRAAGGVDQVNSKSTPRLESGFPPGKSQSTETAPSRTQPPDHSRSGHLEREAAQQLAELFLKTFGLDTTTLDLNHNFFLLGFDSLLLIRLKEALAARYGADFSVDAFYNDLDTPNKIQTWIAQHLENASPSPTAEVEPQNSSVTYEGTAGEIETGIESLFELQLRTMKQLMEQQMDTLRQLKGSSDAVIPNQANIPTVKTDPNVVRKRPEMMFINFEPEPFTPEQAAFVQDLINQFTAKTAGSKRLLEQTRKEFSDWINTVNFRMSLKEILYPLVASTSEGAYFTDIDGNRWLDMAMGYGANFLGHSPAFVTAAIQAQLQRGYQLGPQYDQTGIVAQQLCRITGCERAAFTNSGTEAVMAALRIARAVTGRNKVVIFNGAYHGSFDGVLAITDALGTYPLAPGTPQGMVEDVIILDFDVPDSVERVRSLGSSLAAVLVEPVQSRRPGIHPKAFLQALREATQEIGAALILDEIITGFRIEPGGAQAHFGVRADMVTYGKIVGGGMPIGILAGRARFLDAIDGGVWNYGDTSRPTTTPTMFAGTFSKHPLTIAAVKAALDFLELGGPSIQEQVNRRASRLETELNSFFSTEQVPIRIKRFASLFRFESFGAYDLAFKPIEMDLLFYLMMLRGVYTWERRICFLSIAHTDADVEKVILAVKSSIVELRKGGFAFSVNGGGPGSGPRGGSGTKEMLTLLKGSGSVTPMSSHQQRLYSVCQQARGQNPYHFTMAIDIVGPLDKSRLETAISGLFSRHESLRTSFDVESGSLVQRIADGVIPSLETRVGQTANVVTQINSVIRPFNLACAPLARACLIDLGTQHHVLVFDMHHLITDGLSFEILMSDLFELYQGRSLDPVQTSYRDFTQEEASYLTSERYQKDRAFWANQFSDGRTEFRIPMNPDPQSGDISGRTVWRQIGPDRFARLRQWASGEKASVHAVLLALTNVLLSALNGEEDVVVAGPVSIRPDARYDKTVGLFVNNLVMRNRPKRTLSFRAFLAEVKANTLASLQAKNFPFDHLVRLLGIKPQRHRKPLYDVQFVYERPMRRAKQIEDVTFSAFDFAPPVAETNFMVECIEEESRILLHFKYATALLDDATVNDWADRFMALFDAALADPDQPISMLRHVSPLSKTDPDTQIALKEAGLVHTEPVITPPKSDPKPLEASPEHEEATSVVDLFIASALANPRAIALSFGNLFYLHYETALQRVQQLATFLAHQHGVGPGDRVAILASPSLDVPIAMLAVMMTGAAYVPIDKGDPQNRIERILTDAQVKLVLCDRGLPIQGQTVVTLSDALFQGEISNLARAIDPASPAYVIYTSGTTGNPKGVVIPHRALLNYVTWLINRFELGPKDRSALVSSHAYDLGYTALWGALCSGAGLMMTSQELRRNAFALWSALRDFGTTFAKMTPSLFGALLRVVDLPTLPKLRLLVLGGEPIGVQDLTHFRRLNPQTQLVNHYGPTEATIGCVVQPIDDLAQFASAPVIGSSIKGMRTAIIGEDGAEVQPGQKGELWVSGEGLALGYWNNPEQTEMRFVSREGVRWYRTGDHVYQDPSGAIAFLGRIDDQVKILGYRVEPGEIKRVLLSHSDVRQAHVRVWERGADNRELVAYLVTDAPLEDIRSFLAERVPRYMVPTSWMILPSLPMTPNGKVDAGALPEPSHDQPENEQNHPSAPEPAAVDPVTSRLVEIWSQVLDLKVQPHDDFFEKGGHSIKAIVLLATIRKQLGYEVDIEDLFQAPSPAAMAELLSELAPVSLPGIPQVPSAPDYALSRAQKRLWLASQSEGGAKTYSNYTLFEVHGHLDVPAFQLALDTMVDRHEINRTLFVMVAGEPRMKIMSNMPSLLEVVALESFPDPEEEVRARYAAALGKPFDLSTGPLLRATLFTLNTPDQHFLLFGNHHLISDGWSTEIFIREMFQCYQAFRAKKEPSLSPLPIQYKDYAAWFNQLGNDVLGAHHRYWEEKLMHLPAPMTYPLDYIRSENTDRRAGLLTAIVPSTDLAQIRTTCLDLGVTVFMFLQATLKVLLFNRTGQEDLIIGAPIAGRVHPDLENQIGFYVNLLPLRDRINDQDTFSSFLSQVKRTVLDAQTHELYPFDLMVEAFASRYGQGHHPLFDIMMNYGTFKPLAQDTGGLQIQTLLEETTGSKMDLSIVFRETEVLTLHLHYASALFAPHSMQRLADDLLALARGFAATPETRIADTRSWLGDADAHDEQRQFIEATMGIDEEF